LKLPQSLVSPDLTLVCCVEHGRLEGQTLLMVRSLRAFGGDLANLPIIAVVGRIGAPLSQHTIDSFASLSVQLIYSPHRDNPFPWFNYANKVVAVTLADRICTTATVAWIDSDILFAGQPDGLILSDDEDFAGRYEPIMASVEAGSTKNKAYWQKLCGVTLATYDDLIWLDRENKPSKILYFNSGVFVWRRSSAFAATYADAFVRLLKSRIAQPDGSFFAADQIILNGVITRAKLRWRQMRVQDHHMVFPGLLEGDIAAPHMGESSILHYSGSLSDPYRETFVKRLEAETPELAMWLAREQARPHENRGPHHVTLFAKWLKVWRGLQWRLFDRRAIRILDE
jgi:hypothetical protein